MARGRTRRYPPYLEARNYKTLRERIDRLTTRHANMTEHLATEDDDSLDRYVLLDAQNWMPAPLRAGLLSWLARFHVIPRPNLAAFAAKQPRRTDWPVR